jgi:phosphopantothenoylcysteine synthetase/decarboxylase
VKRGRILVGFALESPLNRQEAIRKLNEKNLDAIALNSPEALAAARSSVEIITRPACAGFVMRNAPKRRIADRIVTLVEELLERVGRKNS